MESLYSFQIQMIGWKNNNMFKSIIEIIILTIHVSGTALIISVILGIPLALLLVNKKTFLSKIIRLIINTGMAIGIMPITGIPLFFLSYGGSSLWTASIGIGILLSIYQRRYRN